MTKIKLLLFCLLAAFLFGAVAFCLTACGMGGRDDGLLRIEAEDEQASLYTVDGAYVKQSSSTPNAKSDNRASGNKFATKMERRAGAMTWVFFSDGGGTTNFYFVMANAGNKAEPFTVGGGYVFTLTLNGRDIYVPETELSAGTEYGDNWERVTVPDVEIEDGLNYAVMNIAEDAQAFNLDYFAVDMRKAAVHEHIHDYKKNTIPLTCETDGKVENKCEECGLEYVSTVNKAIGHNYGTYHYSDETNNMVCNCKVCGQPGEEKTPPTSKYFGEVFEKEEMEDAYLRLRKYETLYEAEDADVHVERLNHGDSYIETNANSHGGAHVGNISVVGNYITFRVKSAEACEADLVLVLANVRYGATGILPLDPMSKFVSFTVNNDSTYEVDFTYVPFPGDSSYDYFNWRYVVIRNVDLAEGLNTFVFAPKHNADSITIPNTDVLYIYTDKENAISAVKSYDINNAVVNNAFVSGYPNEIGFSFGEKNYSLTSATEVTGDLAVTVNSDETIDSDTDLRLSLTYNGKSVRTEGLKLAKGNNEIILPRAGLIRGNNILKFTTARGVTVTRVKAYTETKISVPIVGAVDTDYDYFANKGAENAKVPAFVFEAEDADLGNSKPFQNTLIAESELASGGKHVENMGQRGNSITWEYSVSADCRADIAIRMACANYDSLVGGNANMIDLGQFITLTIDGVLTDLSAVDLECSDPANWTSWTTVAFKNLELKAGDHRVTMTFKDRNFPNTDALYVFTDNDGAVFAPI